MSIWLLALLLLCLLPRRLALVRKRAPPCSHLLFAPLVWGLLALEFLQDPYLEAIPFVVVVVNSIHNLFGDFLDWLCRKSCEVMPNKWTQLSVAGIYCFWLDGFHTFF